MYIKLKNQPQFKCFFSSIKELQEWSLNPLNALFIVDSSTHIVDCNKKAEELFDFTLDSPTLITSILQNNEIEKKIWSSSNFFNKSITIHEQDFLFSALSFFIKQTKYFILVFYKIQWNISDTQDLLQKIIHNDLFGIYIYDGEKFLFFNKSIETMSGYTADELYDMNIWDLIYYTKDKIKLRDVALRRLKGAPLVSTSKFYIKRKTGEKILGEFYLSVITYQGKKAILGVVIDVTEKSKMTSLLKRAQKLEMMGELSGHIYHDFNNYLAGIMGYLSLIVQSVKDNEELTNYIQTAEQICEKASKLTDNLMSLTKEQPLEMNIININDVITESLKILQTPMTKKNINIVKKIPSTKFFIKGDMIKLEEVFINLFSNALEASSSNTTITIEMSHIFLDKHFVSINPDLFEGNYVYITITDEGAGIKKEYLDKIFDPFFSTKKSKKINLGLGLSIVYGIISAHHGHISVYSEENVGTTFKIYLPIENEIIDSPIDKKTFENFKGDGVILVVDDDFLLRKVLISLIEKLGYITFSAQNGKEALEIYQTQKEKGKPIDLVILDLIMPIMDGHKTFYALKKINADVKILISSGYSLTGSTESLLEDGALGFLHKPYRINDLGKKLQEIL